ncbi:Sodium, potassium, lithium and rubidium/H(+) antiporter [Lacunisphaera limnophila]|uniref:Sodium, potassium, lithium and rubidium/H(+) antiporter n=1 Tax=Lacunisphaera limnophila TaxID=1838286 RepID=A0A1D8AZZ8_9BACT|nr:Na+/H+ antiporter [Lacunisphaera limnophila]AOS46468.1 Sodium, potassium, lithium and rubidium/H(+) antiporter [Lacunisphaera limnophila]
MTGFEHALILLLLLALLSVLGRRLPWPLPITYVAGASLAALWPAFPRIDLDPGFFFLCFVPPLLFSDGWLMSLRDFWSAKRPIFTLATGLVVLTTLSVGLVAHWLVPGLPLAMAFALGAVVSPTDAVAVAAITHRLKVPPRLTAVLNGESLMNDATGLVAFKFALGAVALGSFSLQAAALDFVLLAAGGLAVGFAISWTVGRLRDLLQRVHGADAMLETTISLLTPYAAYLAAEALGLSSILAVVAAGLYAGWRDPLRMDAQTRQTTWNVWSVVLFWLNGLAFVLLGLQLPSVLAAISASHTPGQLALFTAAVSGTAMLTRLLWICPGGYVPFLLFRHTLRNESRPPWTWFAVAGWAGMRGTITLAAALSIPAVMADGSPFPGRDLVIFLAAGVIVVTLLLQGTTLEALICRLGVRPDDTQMKEERRARIAAVDAGLKALRAVPLVTTAPEEAAALGEIISEYEHRLAELTAYGETRDSARIRRASTRHHRLGALAAERAALDDLWRRNLITDETHRPLQHLLDHEEAMLRGQSESVETA